jgi:hypothetical protein
MEFCSAAPYNCQRHTPRSCHKRRGRSQRSVKRIEETARPVQQSATVGPEIAAARPQKKNAHSAALKLRAGYPAARSIRKSSIRFPDLSCAVSQRGFFPRPAQVSDGFAGFLYFGNTFG